MKKNFTILVLLIIALVGIIWLINLETNYKYVENELNNHSVEIINNSDFNLSLSCSPEMNIRNDFQNGLGIGLVFKNVKKEVQINSVSINVTTELNNRTLKLKSVHAVDGFYSWKEEYKSEAENFELLPEKFKTVDKDIKAYFVYSWHFDKHDENIDLIKVATKINLTSNGERINVFKENVFKLKSELNFKNPVRFH